MSNPWLQVPVEDYEGHMGHPLVRQDAFVADQFRRTLESLRPQRLLYLGAATGNGLEHVDPGVTTTIVALDVHREYLKTLQDRFARSLPGLIIRCCDFPGQFDSQDGPFDLVYGALFFEYVDLAATFQRLAPVLTPEGTLEALLQQPSPQGRRTDTGFDSLKSILPIMTLHSPDEFIQAAGRTGLDRVEDEPLATTTGKPFHRVRLSRPRTP